MAEVTLSADGQQALTEGERLAVSLNISIESVEFLLAGALSVLNEGGRDDLPERQALQDALRAVHGEGSTPLTDRVMAAPNLREALNMTAGEVRRAGGTVIDAATIARGMIASGEVNPAFYEALGTTGRELAGLLGE